MKSVLQGYAELLSKYLRPQLGRVVLLFLTILVGIGLQILVPQIIRRFIDLATQRGALDELVRLALLVLVVSLGRHSLDVASTYFRTKVGWTATNGLRRDLFHHALHLGMSYHNDRTPGEMIERIDGDVGRMEQFFSQFVLQVVANNILLIGILAAILRESLMIGLSLALFSAAAMLLIRRLRGVAVPYWKAERVQSAAVFGFLEDRMSGTEAIRSSGAKGFVLTQFAALTREWFRREWRATLMGIVMRTSTGTLFDVGIAIGLAIGSILFLRGSITIGTVYLVLNYTYMLTDPLQGIMLEIEELQRTRASMQRIAEVFGSDRIVPDTGQLGLPAGPLRVEYRNVHFSYFPGVPVLKDISFALEPGRRLGLLGRTGSGKSTISRLLFRLYDAQEGSIHVGGRHISEIASDQLHERVAMVTQSVQLFQASVRDNLTFFDPQTNDARILGVLADLGLKDWFASLPDGLDTVLAPGGGGLSAGEAQLLAFARIFLSKDPGVVVLDEASSLLDPVTEQLVNRAVDRLAKGRTMIVIAHRLATIERADDILIIEDGRGVEFGQRAALAADPTSRFSQLLRTGLEELLA